MPAKPICFLSDVFTESFVNTTGVPVELYQTDGSIGAALGAGTGVGFYKNERDAFANRKSLKTISPSKTEPYEAFYNEWKLLLETQLQNKEINNSVFHTI